MNPLEFACFFERFQKSIGYNIDSDIVKVIYDYYENIYDNYTLLELIYQLRIRNIQIICDWNKNSIIQMMKEKNIFIPRKYNMKQLRWQLNNERNYYTGQYENIIYIQGFIFSFQIDDTIQTSSGILWRLHKIQKYQESVCLYFMDILQDNNIWRIPVDKFLLTLDNDNITIL